MFEFGILLGFAWLILKAGWKFANALVPVIATGLGALTVYWLIWISAFLLRWYRGIDVPV